MFLPESPFNQYAVGSKVYNGGSAAPNQKRLGKTIGGSAHNLEVSARRNALLRRLKAGQKGSHMSADWLGGPRA